MDRRGSKDPTMKKISPRSTRRNNGTVEVRIPLAIHSQPRSTVIPSLRFRSAGCIFKSYHARNVSHHAICRVLYTYPAATMLSVTLNKWPAENHARTKHLSYASTTLSKNESRA